MCAQCRGARWVAGREVYTTTFAYRSMRVERQDELRTLADMAEDARREVELPGDGLLLTPPKHPKHMRGRASMVRRATSAQSCHSPSWPTFRPGRATEPLSYPDPDPDPTPDPTPD